MKKEIFEKIKLVIGIVSVITLLILHLTIGDYMIGEVNTVNILILLPISLLLYILMAYDLVIEMIECFKEKEFFNEITLTLIATIAAFCLQEFVEALAVVVFFKLGEAFEDYAMEKSKKSIEKLTLLKPDVAYLYNDKKEIKCNPEDIKINDFIIVKPGEKIPLDGVIVEGKSTLNTSSISGESLPKDVNVNDEVLSGTINIESPLIIKVTKTFYDSTIVKILNMVENATENKSKKEKFISKFSKIYTPIVIALAFFFAIIPPIIFGLVNYQGYTISSYELWKSWITTGASFLVISCPCSLVLSVPLTYFLGIGLSSKNQVLIKGTTYLEYLNKIDTLFLDKTGTITKGNFEIDAINPYENHSNEELITLALVGEYYSNHPIALAIKKYCKENINENELKDYSLLLGKGIKVTYKDKLLLVGNKKLMQENNINFKEIDDFGTILYVAYNNNFIGSIVIKDQIKEDSIFAISTLKKLGVKNIYMLTGDNENIAKHIASIVGINYKANLLPLDKTNYISEHKKKGENVVFIGDGVNDAPSITLSDVGIAMGALGSDAAIEVSDIVIMNDSLMGIVNAKKIAKYTNVISLENIIFSLVIKFGLMIVTILNNLLSLNIDGIVMYLAIFADVGVTILCVLNSMRLLNKKIK